MNKPLKARFAAALFLSASLLSVLACETPQDQSIEAARQCAASADQIAQTNPALAASVASNTCEPLLANIQTQEAGDIGGGLVLLEEQKLSSLTNIENAVNSGTGAVATSISFLVFSSQAHVASIAYYAALSGQSSAQELASVVSLAYYADVVAGGAISSVTTSSQLATYLGTLATNSTNGPPAAQAVLSAKASACSNGPSTLCTDLTNAVGSNTSSYTAILQSVQSYVNSGG